MIVCDPQLEVGRVLEDPQLGVERVKTEGKECEFIIHKRRHKEGWVPTSEPPLMSSHLIYGSCMSRIHAQTGSMSFIHVYTAHCIGKCEPHMQRLLCVSMNCIQATIQVIVWKYVRVKYKP
jgi:hypothetical protein